MRYPLVVLTMATTLLLTIAGPPMAPPMQEWPVYGADQAGTHYWPVTGLDRSTVARL